jgi:vacuolar protein sorting-associated protein 13A/C
MDFDLHYTCIHIYIYICVCVCVYKYLCFVLFVFPNVGCYVLTCLVCLVFQLEGLWVSYRMTSFSETDLYVTIPKFSILDIRPDIKPEMRLMLGSSTDASKQASPGDFPFFSNKGSFRRTNSEAGVDIDVPISTMFLMDYRWRVSSQSFVVRVQQPRVLVVPDFLLAVGEFFVPALGAITGRDETMDPSNDPISRKNSIVLSEPIYKQSEDVVHMSPSRQLVADSLGIDEYIYDGCGKIICLSEKTDVKEFHSFRYRPIIIIGRGKRLRFVNVKIEVQMLLIYRWFFLKNFILLACVFHIAYLLLCPHCHLVMSIFLFVFLFLVR